jgi:diguanylate cyclase (GGDEF)-like protein/PAS domain S-box-containing protein
MPSPDPGVPGPPDRFRAIVEAQSELITLARPDGELVYVNPACARQFGVAAQEMVGRNLFEFVLPEDLALVRRNVAEVLATGEPRTSETRMLDGRGEPCWVAWTNALQREGGQALLLSVGRDVTRRRLLEQELVQSEAFVRKITDSLPLRIAYVDRERRLRFANQAHCRRYGRPREEILGRTREELLGRPDSETIAAHTAAAFAGAVQRFEYDDVVDGTARRFAIELTPDIDPDGAVRGFFYTGLDITERAQAEQALRALTREAQRQSEVLHEVTEAIPATVVVVGADARYRFANTAFERYAGLPRECIIGRTAAEVLGEEEMARRRPFMRRALAGETVSFALDYPHPEGTTWLQLTCIPLRPGGDAVDGFVGIAQDITSQRREQDRLTALSQRDPLTGLLNRAGFEQFLERQVQAGLGEHLGLLYIDLDRFKPVNDEHGHATGDQLLRSAAQRLAGLVRPTDAVARLGGDEFVVLLSEVDALPICEMIAGKMVAAVGEPFDVEGRPLRVGASVGVAFGIAPGADAHELIRRADAALYRAKASGRGRHAT